MCKRSSNLLAALLPLPDLSLKQCGGRRYGPVLEQADPQGVIMSKKECIKSCEIYFAKNVLNLNVKGPSIK